MKVRELAEYCKSILINCNNCKHKTECEKLEDEMENMSPYGVVDIVDRDEELTSRQQRKSGRKCYKMA